MQTKKTNMLKLKLQFFAEEPGDNAQTSEGQEKHRKKFIQKKSLIND